MKSDLNRFNKKNIVFVAYKLSKKGGAERVLRDLIKIVKNEFNIILVSFDKRDEYSSYQLNKEVVWIKLGGRCNIKSFDYVNCIFSLYKLLFFLKNKSLVIGWLYLAYFPLALFKLLGFDKKSKYYGSEHIVYEHYNFLQKLVVDFSLVQLDKTIFVSKYSMDTFNKLKQSNGIILPNILDTHYPKNEYNKPKFFNNNDVFICSVGRLTDQKNFFEAIETIKLLINSKSKYNFNYHIYGDGKYYKKLEKFITQNNLSNNIKLMGVVDKVPYVQYDLTFVPSKYESQCLVILESWRSGVPIFMYSSLSKMLDFVNENNTAFFLSDVKDYKPILYYLENYSSLNSKNECINYYNEIYNNQKFTISKWIEFLNN